MNDMDCLTTGFAVLSKYDDTRGDVSASFDGTIYAGPQNLPEEDIRAEDRARLAEFGWSFDDTIGRWGYR